MVAVVQFLLAPFFSSCGFFFELRFFFLSCGGKFSHNGLRHFFRPPGGSRYSIMYIVLPYWSHIVSHIPTGVGFHNTHYMTPSLRPDLWSHLASILKTQPRHYYAVSIGLEGDGDGSKNYTEAQYAELLTLIKDLKERCSGWFDTHTHTRGTRNHIKHTIRYLFACGDLSYIQWSNMYMITGVNIHIVLRARI